jgi:hypothetical protein
MKTKSLVWDYFGQWKTVPRGTVFRLGTVSLRYDNSEKVSEDDNRTIRTIRTSVIIYTLLAQYRFMKSCWMLLDGAKDLLLKPSWADYNLLEYGLLCSV